MPLVRSALPAPKPQSIAVRIAVCGDGPIAHSIAAVCGWRGHAVSILSEKPSRWRDHLRGLLPDGASFVAPLDQVTKDSGRAVASAEIVLICVPHGDLERTIRRVARQVLPATLVGGVPGFGGFGLRASALLGGGVTAFGTQRIPFVVRGYIPGRSVHIGGIRRQTFVATIPAHHSRPVAELLHHVLGVRTVPVSHYVNVELSPSNSIVNPARLYSSFGPIATRGPRAGEEFFADWDLAASRTLLAIDREVQKGRYLIPRDTSFVTPILMQYDANNATTLTSRIRHLHALAGRPLPIRRRGATVCLDTRSAYVHEDIDRGLVLVRDILCLAGARTPLIDHILEWRRTLSHNLSTVQNHPALRQYSTIEELTSALD